jgi:hypothetical protein
MERVGRVEYGAAVWDNRSRLARMLVCRRLDRPRLPRISSEGLGVGGGGARTLPTLYPPGRKYFLTPPADPPLMTFLGA